MLRGHSLRCVRHKGLASTKLADILKQNANSYRPTASFKEQKRKGTDDTPSSTFTANEVLENRLSDLSSVASMNTILGILEDAQKGVEADERPRARAGPEAAPVVSRGDTASYLDSFFKVAPAAEPTQLRQQQQSQHKVSLSHSYKSRHASRLGRDVYEYAIVRYLNDQGVSERGQVGETAGLAVYQPLMALLCDAFEHDWWKFSKYGCDKTLTLNGSLSHYQAIAMHFAKRPGQAIALLLAELDKMVTLSDALAPEVKSPQAGSSLRENAPLVHDAASHTFRTPTAAQYKLPQEFQLYDPHASTAFASMDPTMISPIYTTYDLLPLQHRLYLIQLPFILNDAEVISRVLVNHNAGDVERLRMILQTQSLEGFKLYDVLVRLKIMHRSGDAALLTDPIVKAAVATKSHLLSKVNRYAQRIPQSFSERAFDESTAISLLEQQFNIYLAVWYRVSIADATQWCANLVHHHLLLRLTMPELEALREELLTYFKQQTRSERVDRMITEELHLSNLARALVLEAPETRRPLSTESQS